MQASLQRQSVVACSAPRVAQMHQPQKSKLGPGPGPIICPSCHRQRRLWLRQWSSPFDQQQIYECRLTVQFCISVILAIALAGILRSVGNTISYLKTLASSVSFFCGLFERLLLPAGPSQAATCVAWLLPRLQVWPRLVSLVGVVAFLSKSTSHRLLKVSPRFSI